MSASPQRRGSAVLWSAYSRVYDGLLHVHPYRELLSMVSMRLGSEEGDRVLDLGCGTGNVISAIRRAAHVDATGVDSSVAMLTRARHKLEPDVTLVRADILDFLRGCQAKSYERVSAVNVLYAIKDRRPVWTECLRVIGPKGRVVAVVPDRSGRMPIIRDHLSHASLSELLRPSLLGVAALDWLICALSETPTFEFPTRDTLEREVVEAGGRVVSVERCYGGARDGVALLLVVERRVT